MEGEIKVLRASTVKNRKKPDLLVVLAAILGLGVAASVVGQDQPLPSEGLQITQN